VLALDRHGYQRRGPRVADVLDMARYGGFWRMGGRYWRAGLAELRRSLSRRAFVGDVQRLVPDLTAADLEQTEPGIRAQAVDPDGRLVDDFRIVATGPAVHVLCAPSPAATASISIGRYIAQMATGEGRGG
jgi:L-2-hydroxyglutarate oxidase